MPLRGWPSETCPDCKVPMGVTLVTQDGTGGGKVVYACVICRAEIEQPFKAPPPSPPSPPSAERPS